MKVPAATINGAVEIAAETYEYNEVKYGAKGGGNRGIRIRCGTRDQTYKLAPNPHGNAKYNKNQAGFYTAAATAIVGTMSRNGLFPRYGIKISVFDEEYTLGPR